MQVSCRSKPDTARLRPVWALVPATLVALSALAAVLTGLPSAARAQNAPQAQPQSLAATTKPAEAAALTQQAARWLASQMGLKTSQVQIQAPDPRLKVPSCEAGLRFDTPFGNRNTVRARCEATQWQLYMRASWDEPEAPAGPAPTANGTATAPSSTQATQATPASPATARSERPAEPRRALMLVRAVPRGALLGPASVEAVLLPAREADSLIISDPQALQAVEAVRDLSPGTPLRQTDVRPATLVRQGQIVTMKVGQGSGFVITVRLEALQDGRLGDRVTLRNSESGRTVSGVVTGLNEVRGA